MDALECILSRKSVRKFKPEPVPRNILLETIETAQRSPSYKNSQPWEITVLSGSRKEALTKLLVGLIESDTPLRPDVPEPTSWPSTIAARMKAAGAKRNKELAVPVVNEAERLKKSKLANARFYGAPHGLFLYQDIGLSEWSMFDIGCFAQTLMLSANARGLGTVPQAYLTDYSPDVKKFLGIPESKRLVLGMSIGYPDLSSVAATFVSERVPTSEIVKWVE